MTPSIPASRSDAGEAAGLILRPFRAVRPAVGDQRVGRMLCPPYDVIGEAERVELAARDPGNAVAVVLPRERRGKDRYQAAAELLQHWLDEGTYRVDDHAALYVYEMTSPDGSATRGLVGAVALRDPADGVILPHENTMAGPVADRLALMTATQADVEPIYLVYDGGGAASHAVAEADARPVLADATTPDGVRHRLWAITESGTHRRIDADLAPRRALIADGHHRYATYRELQTRMRAAHGPGPWDYGLTLLVDSTSYGPQVHAIHRVVRGLSLDRALTEARSWAEVLDVPSPEAGLARAEGTRHFAVVLSAGQRAALLVDHADRLRADAEISVRDPELAGLDVTVLHRALVPAWGLSDEEQVVDYAHSVAEAIDAARQAEGVAVLLRPTPVAAVATVAAAGARMPRKSTLFTPKPASGLVMRRFADER